VPVSSRFALFALLSLVTSFSRGTNGRERLPARRYVPLALRIDTIRSGQLDDTLARPLLLSASNDRVYYFDYGDSRLNAIDMRGRLLWRVGRRGRGPNEWANPTSIVATREGGVVVVDGSSSRFTRVDADGAFVQSVTTPSIPARIARGSGTSFIAFGTLNGRPNAQVLDSTFATVRTLPWSGWPDSAMGLAAQLRVASGRSGNVAAVSIATGRVFPLRTGMRLDSGVDGVGARPLPPRVPLTGDNGLVVAGVPAGTKPVIRDAAIVGDLLFVLPAGDEFDGRTLDLYDAKIGTYRVSIRVPVPLHVLSGTSADLIAVSLAEFPAILRLSWDRTALERVIR
jgi:hypothetical protein